MNELVLIFSHSQFWQLLKNLSSSSIFDTESSFQELITILNISFTLQFDHQQAKASI